MSNIIKGRWRWNDVVYCKWQAPHQNYDIAFKCNAEAFCTIFLDWSVGYHSLTYIDVNSNYVLAGKSQNEGDDFYSVDEAYRIMDFGETDQLIDDELYNFISENAEPYRAPLTIAEKLAVIAENEQKVYDAGYNSGYKVGFEEGKAGDGYGEGFEAGKQAEYDAFWDAYQENGSASREYEYAFREGFNDENFKPKYDFHIKGNYSGSGMFSRSKITDIVACLNRQGVVWECSQALRLDSTFQQALTKTVPIIDASVLTRLQQTFNGATNLQEIVINNLQAACTFSIAFNSCSALTTVSITGEIGNDINFQWSTKLTRASIESIINHLSDNGSGKTLTLSKAAVDEAFRGISAGDFTTIVPGSSSLDWFNLTHDATVYKQWTITLV